MNQHIKNILFVFCLIVWVSLQQSCTHEPTFDMNMDPDPKDTTITDPICNTLNVSYAETVSKFMETSCDGCHGTSAPSGGIITDSHKELKNIAMDGRLFGSINWENGYSNMPLEQDQLEDCTIDKIKSWIDDGAQDN